jgi:hypothetical protein
MHSSAIRIASQTTQTPGLHGTNRIIYHTLRPHHALTPIPSSPDDLANQQENESAWCQMVVNRALALLLPYDEHQNPCLQVLVSEILSEMIFHNGICGKACESWLIWEGVTKTIYAVRPDLIPEPQPSEAPQVNRLTQFGLVSKDDNNAPVRQSQHRRLDSLSQAFWAVLQSLWLAWVLLRSSITVLMQASSLPVRSSHSKSVESESSLNNVDVIDHPSDLDMGTPHSSFPSSDSRKVPILGMTLWTCLSKLTRLQDRMPWLIGTISLVQWLLLYGPGRLCCTDSRLDR